MARPRKWPGDTQAERNLAMDRDRRRREREERPDRRQKSKYPGDTPQERQRARNRAYIQRHHERIREKQRVAATTPEYKEAMRMRGAHYRAKLTTWDRRIMNLRGKYKLTVEQFNAMMATQSGKCAICGETFGLWCMPAVDHCHTTGKVRGILCGFCNRMLGIANDDTERLTAAITYLSQPLPDMPQEALAIRRQRLPDGQIRSTREKQLRSRYGITLWGYEYLVSLQNGNCLICCKPFGSQHAHIDHDHASQRVRGLLCRKCNVLLGMARDNSNVIHAAIGYLEATNQTL